MTLSRATTPPLLTAHWRPAVAAIVGVGAGLTAAGLPLLDRHPLLIGWDAGALTYIALLWGLFLTADEKAIRDRAGRQDDGAGIVMLVVMAAIGASLGGIVMALLNPDPDHRAVTPILVAATLALGWGLMHSVFVPHYAHRHFAAVARNKDAGVGFPGEPPRSYLDFAYMAFTIGATFQVSDNTVGSTRLRNLVTAHALAAYVYNTAILTVGISLLANAVSS
ncbi:MAG TPA: DUF1345 domain-containing protein [Caulobacter sp.]|nr:DUF1345 domain-containing protein [Caulobacter sp.]